MSRPYGFLHHDDESAIEKLFDGRGSPGGSQFNENYTKKKQRRPASTRHIPTYDFSDSLGEPEFTYDPSPEISGSRDELLRIRRTAESAKSEHAALLVKNSSLLAQVSELKSSLAIKDASLQEVKEELADYKEGNARQAAQVQYLKSRVQEYERMSSSVNGEKTKTKAEIYSLGTENKELNERIRELESRLKIHLIEREKTEQKSSSLEKKLQESVEKLASYLNTNIENQADPLNVLLPKVEKLVNGYFLLKTKVSSLEDALAGREAESKAGRDAIVQLVSESDKNKKTAAGMAAEMKSLKRERDEAVLAKKNTEREKEVLLEKLKDSHKEWGSVHKELLEKDKKIKELDLTIRTSGYEAKASHSLHHNFISQLATILSNGFITVPETEEAIKERILEIYGREQKWKSTSDELQEKVNKLTKQLDQQRDLYHEAATKSYKTEEMLQKEQDTLKHLKGKLASEEMIKDGFNMERKKLKKFLTQLAETLQISEDVASESLGSQYERLLNRAEELFKRNKDFGSENKTAVYSLQKKVNSLMEKAELKSSQVAQLEKKIKELEKEKERQLFASVENPANLTAQKLQRKVERLQGQLGDMKIANQNLTAQLVDRNELKETSIQQRKTIEELSRSLEKLEKIKEKAAKKVVSLKTELDYSEHEHAGDKRRSQHLVDSVANELHTTKRALEEVARREKQLVDFRETVTRMMGFSINTLAVPDHEVFEQLKRVLRTSGAAPEGRMDRTKLPYGFRTGDGEPEYTVQHLTSYKNPRDGRAFH
ncbi:coiled-coil domain-containing protein 170-like [Spea bombifrons]|uniref:coiled-coil domain-containing protein 170-like n=1 Tax=Spea bombifrons TaxID=233779 RepID=UPI00234A5070|nr:coiled-coil domain-containing protein 170-like [Spea bombifrons]